MGSTACAPEFCLREMFFQKVSALSKPLQMGENDPDILKPTFREQTVLDFDNNLSNYYSIVFEKKVKSDTY